MPLNMKIRESYLEPRSVFYFKVVLNVKNNTKIIQKIIQNQF